MTAFTLLDGLRDRIARAGVHAALGGDGSGYGIEQNADELAVFLTAMHALEVRSVLEIGTGYRAGLARFLSETLGWDVTTVDVRDYGHELPGVKVIVLEWAGVEFPVFNRQFDLVFIDGDHAYESVCFDADYYATYASKAVAFHDIAGLRDCEGAARYWREIAYADGRLKPGYHEATANGDTRAGIGWLVKAEA